MVTVKQSPATYQPGYNDIIFVVDSDHKTDPGFNYIADLYIAGISNYIRIKAPSNPTYGSGVFNFGRIIESYINSDINKSTYGFQQNPNSYARYVVKFGEEYGLASSGTTIYPNQVTTASFYAWNAEVDFLGFQQYSNSDYTMTSGTTSRFLTNQPSNISIRDSEAAWLYGISNTSGTIKEARIVTYTIDGGVIQTVKASNPYQSISSTDYRFVRFGSGTHNLNLINSSGITSGAQPIIDPSVASYDVSFLDYAGNNVSGTQTYTIENSCTRNDTFRFHFLNQLGGFDSFTFIRASTKSVDIKRSNYKRATGGFTSSSVYGYNKSDRGTVQFNTMLQDGIKVKSDWISEDVSEWLEELISSPEVYLDDPTHGLVAVNIQNPKYEIKQSSQEKLFSLEIDFDYSFNRYRQRG